MPRAAIIILAIATTACLSFAAGQSRVCLKEHCFQVELAQSGPERARGLMFRESLAPDQGMLFVFQKEGKYSLWMKNALIPLDIIWIDFAHKAVFISRNTPPCVKGPCVSLNPEASAKYVLEVPAGTADRIGLKAGDIFAFDLE